MSLIHQLSTTKGFINRYLHHLNQCETQQEAWEKTENEYFIIFERKKYINFESFRRVKNRQKSI